jgi:type I restriction enzyme S subunit
MMSEIFEQVKGEGMGWSTIKLGEVLKHRKGSINIDDDKDYKLCRVQLHRKGVLLREVIKGSEIRTKKQQVCKGGDFLVAEMDAKFGGYGFIPPELDGAIVSSHYFLFELDQNKIRPDYLEVVSQLNIIQSQIKAVGSTNYSAVRPVNVLSWEIPITSIDNQIKIEILFKETKVGSKLLTTELTHQLTLVKKLRQQLLQDAMLGKLVRQDKNDEPASKLLAKIKEEKAKNKKQLTAIKPEEIPSDVPDNWVWCRLGDISNIVRGGSPRPAGDKRYYDGDIPFLKVGDLTGYENMYLNTHTHSIKEAGLHKTRFVEANTLMLTNSGATLGIPRICTFPTTFNDGIAAFLDLIYIDQEYLYYFLKSKSEWYLREASRGQGQPNLNTDIIASTFFPMPPLAEQRRIVTKLEDVMRTCEELEASIHASRGQNEQLLQQVLREALKG